MTRTTGPKTKNPTAEDIDAWMMPDVLVWDVTASGQKEKSNCFSAAGGTWQVVRTTTPPPHHNMTIALHNTSGKTRPADTHNAITLRLLVVNCVTPVQSLLKEKDFILDGPKDCSLSMSVAVDDLLNPEKGFARENHVQVRAMVRSQLVDEAVVAQAAAQATRQRGRAASAGDPQPMEGEGVGEAPDVVGDNMLADSQDGTANGNGAGPSGVHAAQPFPFPGLANKKRRLDGEEEGGGQENGGPPGPSGVHGKEVVGSGNAGGGGWREEAQVRSAVLRSLSPLVAKWRLYGGPTRSTLWDAVTNRITLMEAQMMVDVGIQMLQDEMNEDTGRGVGKSVLLLREMLHLP